MSAANSRYKQSHVKLRIYHCDRCNFFHLTKQLTYKFMDEQTKEVGVETPAEQPVETSAGAQDSPVVTPEA